MVVVGCLHNQWSFDDLAGIYVCMAFGVICSSPDSWQNWLIGAWYDLSSSFAGGAWRSPLMRVVTVGNLAIISVCIHVRISV